MKHEIDTSGWKEFKVDNLFDVQKQSYKATKAELDEDDGTPVYSAETKNNGRIGYVAHAPEFIVTDDCPTYLVFGDHTKACDIVHESFVGMDNIKVLKPKYVLSDTSFLFVSTIWSKAIPNLGYARHWPVAKKVLFKLPAVPSGDPDWDYMDAYMSKIMGEEKAVADELTA